MNNNSKAGYFGAFILFYTLFFLSFMLYTKQIEKVTSLYLFTTLSITMILMIIFELRNKIKLLIPTPKKNILSSTFYRYISLLIPFLLVYMIIHFPDYRENFIKYLRIDFVQSFYNYILIIFISVVPFYIYFTLKYKGSFKYDLNDYAILIMIGFSSLYKKTKLYTNRRVKKVLFIYLINAFFITLMISFFSVEFTSFYKYFYKVLMLDFASNKWIDSYRDVYHLIFHFLFFIDVGIALVGYLSASRWLGNTVKSIDYSTIGLFVALVCYPPFNSYWSTWLTGYRGYDTHQLITNDYINAFILFVMILLFTFYTLSTMALGFKFGNLVNKGIVSSGTYSIIRHPSYSSKNLAWIIDNTFVYSNIFAFLAFTSWNFIYYMRAITEEKHLSKEKSYTAYKSKVKYKFIPKAW